jgi:hypothetical protein
VTTEAETPKSIELWLSDWERQDYSWEALDKIHGPKSGVNLTDFWRRGLVVGGHIGNFLLRTDEQLLAEGLLVDCGERGLFHIAYLPKKWFDELPDEMVPSREYSELLDQAWNEKFQPHLPLPSAVWRGAFLNSQAATRLAQMQNVLFENCCFTADFAISVVDRELRFNKCLFLGDIESQGFGYPADETRVLKFDACEFFADVSFTDGIFHADLILDQCHFYSLFSISDAKFGNTFLIASCEFMSRFSLIGSKISHRFSVLACNFSRDLELLQSHFVGEVSFNEILLLGDIYVVACRFDDKVRFADINWPKLDSYAAQAHETLFAGNVAFSGEIPPPIQLFDDIRFDGAVSFPRASDKAWLTAFDGEMRAIRRGSFGRFAPTEMQQLESGCRTLRNLASGAGNVHLEHQWHRCELIARRNRDDVSHLERGLSRFYGVCADYGLSIWRPFTILAMLCALFGPLYATIHSGIELSEDIDWRSLTEGFGYSFNRALPIGVFEFSDSAWRKELLGSAGTWGSLGVRAMASFQTIVSVILIYLGVMAARRKFKIS